MRPWWLLFPSAMRYHVTWRTEFIPTWLPLCAPNTMKFWCENFPHYQSFEWFRHSNSENSKSRSTESQQINGTQLSVLFQVHFMSSHCLCGIVWNCKCTVQWWTWTAATKTSRQHDFIKWKHFPRYWPFVWGIHRSPVNSPDKGQWRGALMFSLICALNKRMNKHSWAGDLRRHCAHYDVIVMMNPSLTTSLVCSSKEVAVHV